MSSSDALPISPTRFAAALADLPLSTLHLKVLELRNSIAHLDYSNEQLRPFAEGVEVPISSSSSTASTTTTVNPTPTTSFSPINAATATTSGAGAGAGAGQQQQQPDQDCIDAIRENEEVIARMQTRIGLIREEVEGRRGLRWDEFQGGGGKDAEEAKAEEEGGAPRTNGARTNGHAEGVTNGTGAGGGGATNGTGERRSPWTDGTFQTGTIRNGEVRMDAVAGSSSTSQAAAPAPAAAAAAAGGRGGGPAAETTDAARRLADGDLRRAVERRMRQLEMGRLGDGDGDGEEGGMHL